MIHFVHIFGVRVKKVGYSSLRFAPSAVVLPCGLLSLVAVSSSGLYLLLLLDKRTNRKIVTALAASG